MARSDPSPLLHPERADRGRRVWGGLLTALILALQFAPIPGAGLIRERLESLWYDLRLVATLETGAMPRNIAIVDIDEHSLATIGRWPWPRSVVADMTDALIEAGAAVVAFDMVFAEPEDNPVDRVRAAADAAGLETMDLHRLARALDGDRALAASFAGATGRTEIVLGAFIDTTERTVGELGPSAVRAARPLPGTIRGFRGYAANLPGLTEHASTGFITTVPDGIDGVVRTAPLLSRYRNRIYPSLALETARRWLLLDHIDLETASTDAGPVLTAIRLGEVRIATDPAGRVAVPYSGPRGTIRWIAAAGLLDGGIAPHERAALDGAAVLIGTSAIGAADLVSTPVGSGFPGVEVHANVLHAILETARIPGVPRFPHRPDWTPGAVLVATLAVGIVFTMLVRSTRPLALMFIGLAGVVSLGWANVLAWQRLRLDLLVVPLLLLVVLIVVTALVRGFLREAGTRRAMREMFDQYVPPAHVERILAEREAISFAGETREMTVLFSDIRDFTSISEHLEATQLKQMLNTFFTPVTETIFAHRGTIDKYVGDMVMAFWNAPLADADHRENAISAALEMLAIVSRLREHLAARGLPAVSIGIGINTGLMNVGDMGSEFRRAYTVMGDAVNLGSRIESITKRYCVPLLVGEETRDGCDAFLYRFIDRVQVKGKQQGVRVYQPMARLDSAPRELVERVTEYHAAYWLFAGREWDRAAAAFDRLIAREPDCLLYRVYRHRIDALRSRALPQDWDGTEILLEK